MNTEVGGDLLDRRPVLAVTAARTISSRNSLGYGLGTATSFQPALPGKLTQDVNSSCSRPARPNIGSRSSVMNMCPACLKLLGRVPRRLAFVG